MNQFLLAPERQHTLDGREEPLLSEPAAAEESQTSALEDEVRQTELALAATPAQLALPLPLAQLHVPLGERAPHKDCVRGFRRGGCTMHELREQMKVLVETCARQRCESSRATNTLERARDLMNGTADDPTKRLALRHFGDVPWAVFVFTIPAELRALAVGDRLRTWRKRTDALALKILRRHVDEDRADFYVRSWLHPVGDAKPAAPGEVEQEDGTDYKPHNNIIVPLVGWHPTYGREIKVRGWALPKEWLGAGGWVNEELVTLVADVFGPHKHQVINWFYEFRQTHAEKIHALKYFARVFPQWAQHPQVPLRPRASGLAHWKKKQALYDLLEKRKPLPTWGACLPCEKDKPNSGHAHKVYGVGATEELADYWLDRELARHRLSCESCATAGGSRNAYVQHRRIIDLSAPPSGPPNGRSSGPGPPEQPEISSSSLTTTDHPSPAAAARWRSFLFGGEIPGAQRSVSASSAVDIWPEEGLGLDERTDVLVRRFPRVWAEWDSPPDAEWKMKRARRPESSKATTRHWSETEQRE